MPDCAVDVSLIIPVHNAAPYLRSLFRSIGDPEDWFEIIVVNDGSVDDSLELCVRESQVLTNLRVVSQENQGVSSARNVGLAHCRGDWLVFVDADDVLDVAWRTAVREALSSARDHAADICLIGRDVESRHYAPIECAKAVCGAADGHLRWAGSPFSKLFRREFLLEESLRYREELTQGEDALFNLESYLRAQVIVGLPVSYYIYRKNLQSVTNRSSDRVIANEIAYQNLLRNVLEAHELDASFASLRERAHLVGLCATLHRCSGLSYLTIEEDLARLVSQKAYADALSRATAHLFQMSVSEVAVIGALRAGLPRLAWVLAKGRRLLKDCYYAFRGGEVLERV